MNKDLVKQLVADWMSDGPRKHVQDDLLGDMMAFADSTDRVFFANKVMRVQRKAYRAGKKALAARIEAKYAHLFPKSDMSVAIGFALMTARKFK